MGVNHGLQTKIALPALTLESQKYKTSDRHTSASILGGSMNIYLGFSVVFFMLFTPSLSISSIQIRPVLATVSTAAMLKRNYFTMLIVILAVKM